MINLIPIDICEMSDEAYIIFNKNGIKDLRKGMPKLKAGEYAVKLKMKVPGKYFDNSFPEETMELDENTIINPNIKVGAITNTEQVLDELGK